MNDNADLGGPRSLRPTASTKGQSMTDNTPTITEELAAWRALNESRAGGEA